MSNNEGVRPGRVEVGQRYRFEGPGELRGKCFTITGVRKKGGDNQWDDGISGFAPLAWLMGPECTYLGGPPSPPAEGGSPIEPVMGRDWKRWLPPGPLPDTGDKELRDGQIWAFNLNNGNGIIRVRVEGGSELLASTTWTTPTCSFGRGGNHQRHAILVADVGCEPTDPEILYGPRSSPRPKGEGDSGTPSASRCNASPPIGHEANRVEPLRQAVPEVPAPAQGERGACQPHEKVPFQEVSPDKGKSWLPYRGYLSDADPFDRYLWRREDGVLVATQATADVQARADTDLCDEFARNCAPAKDTSEPQKLHFANRRFLDGAYRPWELP